MLTQAQQVIALRSRYATEGLPQEEHLADERLAHQRVGQLRILAQACQKLAAIRVDMEPAQVEKKVVSLLNWLVSQKICWMSGMRRRRSSDDLWKAWQVEGAIEQIDSVLRELCQTFPSEWEHSSARHGHGFQVFHGRDLIADSTGVEPARQRWCGPSRELWYQEVAIVSLKRAEDPLEEIFQLTNHIDQPWPRHREVAWSLDMLAFAASIARILRHYAKPIPPTGPSYPRSTSVGDVVVSLLSGTAWIVAPSGFKMITEEVTDALPLSPKRDHE